MRIDPQQVARELRARSLDGWLLYDFRGQNPIAIGALELEGRKLTRRWFYLLPADGEPVLIVHAIERGSFPPLPGRVQEYAAHESLASALTGTLHGRRKLAMEYVPLGAMPTLSRVDAGTVEKIRETGAEVVSSADLVQHFLSRLTAEQIASHVRAVGILDQAQSAAFAWVASRLRNRHAVLETDVQQFLLYFFRDHGLITDHPPIVAAGPHSGDPHYSPSLERPTRITANQVLLIDLWAKENDARAVWGDITWVAYVGAKVPERVAQVFDVVTRARDLGLGAVRSAHAAKRRIEGWQIDRVVRDFIDSRGFGERFIHRTGHNIGDAHVHGDGANIDDFETHDTREIVSGLAFSIEPGVYLEDFGIRSEIDVVMLEDSGPQVYSPIQTTMPVLLPDG